MPLIQLGLCYWHHNNRLLSVYVYLLSVPSLHIIAALSLYTPVSAYLQVGGEREWKVERENISALSAIFSRQWLTANAENHCGKRLSPFTAAAKQADDYGTDATVVDNSSLSHSVSVCPYPLCGPADDWRLLPLAFPPLAFNHGNSSTINSAACTYSHQQGRTRLTAPPTEM